MSKSDILYASYITGRYYEGCWLLLPSPEQVLLSLYGAYFEEIEIPRLKKMNEIYGQWTI